MRKIALFTLFLSILLKLSVLFGDDNTVNHQLFDQQLQKYVKEGQVNYTLWLKDKNTLTSYLDDLAQVNYKQLSKPQQKAFYINLYNAATVKLILDHFPKRIKSIKDIPNRWNLQIITLKDKKISLNDLEHKILRVKFHDSRIHFAINCASVGCPDLWHRAYSANNLDQELNNARTRFLSNPKKGARTKTEPGKLWGTNHTLKVSKIFDWFDEDFERETGSIQKYIEKHGTQKDKKFIKKYASELNIDYFDYDWLLNGF